MMRTFYLVCIATFYALANPLTLELTGISVRHTHADGTVENVRIERNIPSTCLDVGIQTETIFGGNYAGTKVAKECQKSFVTVVGKAQPMSIAPGVQTVGEVEVLDFIAHKLSSMPQEYILVDSRKRDWFEQMTIAGSVNIPYDEIDFDSDFPEDSKRMMHLLGFEQTEKGYDFTKAKKALFFCNGPWCAQSRYAIQKLIKLGYPKEKLLWYRGGLQDWLIFGFSVVKPVKH
jgi:rhodanese-related sulfurtransferase